MATFDLSTGVYSVPADGGRVFVMKNVIDFADQNVAQNETATIFSIPADVKVLDVVAKVLEVQANVNDINVGLTGGTTDGWIDGLDPSTNAIWHVGTVEGYNTSLIGRILKTAWNVDLINLDAHTLVSARIAFFALCVDYRGAGA